jgi:Protein of unknown function (DUF2442)
MKLGTQIARITGVQPETYRVTVEYSDGFKGTVDLASLFSAASGKPLASEILRGDLFSRCFVENGALAWPNGCELCPDSIRLWIERAGHSAA